MKNNIGDGTYIMEFTNKNGNIERSAGGYYTNGGVLDNMIKFSIKSDTILVKTSMIKY